MMSFGDILILCITMKDCHFGVSPVNYSDSDSDQVQIILSGHLMGQSC